MNSPDPRTEVLNRLTGVFRDVFDDDRLVLTERTCLFDLPDWDSLRQVTLCVAVGREFETRLNALDLAACSEVGQWVDYLLDRRA